MALFKINDEKKQVFFLSIPPYRSDLVWTNSHINQFSILLILKWLSNTNTSHIHQICNHKETFSFLLLSLSHKLLIKKKKFVVKGVWILVQGTVGLVKLSESSKFWCCLQRPKLFCCIFTHNDLSICISSTLIIFQCLFIVAKINETFHTPYINLGCCRTKERKKKTLWHCIALVMKKNNASHSSVGC